MAFDLVYRRQIPGDFSRGAETYVIPALTPGREGLRQIAIMALGIGSALAASYPEIRRFRDRRSYLREYTDDPRITCELPAISDVMIMSHHKTKPAGKQRRVQKQAERELEADRRYYRRMYAKDRAITQEVPIVPMSELVHGGHQS